jgi:hypothetical protein|tara:strand:- start:791 stop:1216 length:426 start_codon:yes stop_codon:yes gene_type:complete
MISLLTSVAPIALGFFAKLFAMKQHANSEQQKLMIQAMNAQNQSINMARDMAAKESPFAAMNRRIIILVILGILVTIQFAPLFGLDTVIPTVTEGFSILGMQFTPDTTTYEVVSGMVKHGEAYAFAEMIISFFFGSQLAKK